MLVGGLQRLGMWPSKRRRYLSTVYIYCGALSTGGLWKSCRLGGNESPCARTFSCPFLAMGDIYSLWGMYTAYIPG